jgi:transcriptional regulator of NAD metabolism
MKDQQERAELVKRLRESGVIPHVGLLDEAARLLEEDGQEIERLEQALEELGQAHRLLAAQGLMAALSPDGEQT